MACHKLDWTSVPETEKTHLSRCLVWWYFTETLTLVTPQSVPNPSDVLAKAACTSFAVALSPSYTVHIQNEAGRIVLGASHGWPYSCRNNPLRALLDGTNFHTPDVLVQPKTGAFITRFDTTWAIASVVPVKLSVLRARKPYKRVCPATFRYFSRSRR